MHSSHMIETKHVSRQEDVFEQLLQAFFLSPQLAQPKQLQIDPIY